MCTALLLIQHSRRNKMIKGRLKGLLRLVRKWDPAIPARGAERTRGVVDPLEQLWKALIGGRSKGHLIQLVGVRIVQSLITADTAAEAVHALQIRLHIRAPLGIGPTCSRLLNPGSRVHGETDRAVRIRRIQIISERVRSDAHIIDLVEIVKLWACECLLLHRECHFSLVVRVDGVKGCAGGHKTKS